MRRLLLALAALLLVALPLAATDARSEAKATTGTSPIQMLLQEHGALIRKSSRKTIGPAIDALVASGLPEVPLVLEKWQGKEMWSRKSDGFFVWGEKDGKQLVAFSFEDSQPMGQTIAKDFKQIKPNSGIRAMLGAALVQFQLSDPDPARRAAALDAIERDAEPSHLSALRGASRDPDLALAVRKARLERLLTIRFDEDDAARIAAIESFEGDVGVDLRATLTPLTATAISFAAEVSQDPDVAGLVVPGDERLGVDAAYDMLVAAEVAPARMNRAIQRATLIENIEGTAVGGVQVASLGNLMARDAAYATLVEAGKAAPLADETLIASTIDDYVFFTRYIAAPPEVAIAAELALGDIETRVAVGQTADLALDALSLASIYFLAAIGLAITFGVMGVINMAHGEFIMMGAYTGYVVQLLISDYTLSLIVAIPAAFLVTAAAGIALERLVIRWLYHRPLETLLATFGISIALQQLAKNIFGTQARPLTSPDWLCGAWVLNDVVSISYIRIAIFVLALLFLAVFLWVMNRTRLGLEVRAVTQNRRMAGSMGINPDKINMLTFGLGSGIAGVAGIAIGLYAKVTSEMGQDYIVQSFMTVVVGGVGNIWGTLLGATLIGTLQKGIEWFNPSNTLAAQTYMILFIILFIQFRPRGLIALKGRAAEV